jgi:hypothetical protein
MRLSVSAARPHGSRVILLAPAQAQVPGGFRCVETDPERHAWILGSLQRLRGSVYLNDGAITSSELTADGRHVLDVDDRSWHVVAVQPDGEVTGCARYRSHGRTVRPQDLGLWTAADTQPWAWRRTLYAALEREIRVAQRKRVAYVEVGGWAVAEDRRFMGDALRIALSTYALASMVGGCIGIATATVRNCSSRILRKIGGRALEVSGRALDPYYDPHYRCDMEIIRFDSTAPQPRVQEHIDRIVGEFRDLAVVCASNVFHPAIVHQPSIVRHHPMPEFAYA